MNSVMRKVSVVMPVLNGAATIHDAIKSVANQHHQNLELIVVDDGSGDASFDVARQAIESFGIDGRVIRRPNGTPSGAGSCRNIGVGFASGDIVAFLDADDMWQPEHLARAIAAFARNGDDMGVYSAMCQTITSDGIPVGKMPDRGFPLLGLSDALPFLLREMFVPTVTLCVRTSEFRHTGGFSEALACYEDWWLVLQLAARTRFYFDDGIGCVVRIGSDSLTRASEAKTARMVMSDAMYADQLNLFSNARRASFLDASQLSTLRHAIIEWNARQLNDLVSGAQVRESVRVFKAIARSQALDLVGPICMRTFAGVGRRAASKLMRVSFGTR
jgi:glycosyltransferase involved in cell wall biosynthesis